MARSVDRDILTPKPSMKVRMLFIFVARRVDLKKKWSIVFLI